MKNSICVIDDDVIYQQIIKKLIQRAGVFQQAIFFTSAEEALQKLDVGVSGFPSVILLDINMPIMDGWQFIQHLERTCPGLYENCDIYIVTSSISYSDKEKMEEFPLISGFLSKPLSLEQLKRMGTP